MSWPVPVLRRFEKLPTNPTEADFHGPYNKLLYTLFPANTAFTVVPQYVDGLCDESEFLFWFEVTFEDRPVFVIKLQSPRDLRYVSKRETTNEEIRHRIRDLCDEGCPIPNKHVVSAMGTKLSFFVQRPGQPIDPLGIAPNPVYGNETDTAPRERWNYDILEEEGEQKFRAVVQEITEACAAL